LEARLNATSAGIAPFVEGKKPEMHFLCALGWFHDIGLEEPSAITFVNEMFAPLGDDVRTALPSLFQMRWGNAKSEVSEEDWERFQRLCQPDSPDHILNHSDYYAFFTYSMFQGKVAY
jgi:demethylmenaquinone methyltransferase/2-methoxy-6-polyprenyl-1,4-benzoquinol methylase